MRIILFANVRDEKNLLEWVVHHINLGFTHIYITDHKSQIPVSSTLYKVPQYMVTVVKKENILKSTCIMDAHKYAVDNNYDWMLYLDADEFLYLNYDCVSDFLQNYLDYDQVGMKWLYFGTNYLSQSPQGTILENYTRSAPRLDQHIKCFLNLRHKSRLNNGHPHYYPLKDMSKSVYIDYNLLDKDEPYFYKQSPNINEANAYICHYVYQSYEDYMNRKIKLPSDDGTFRKIKKKEEL